MLLFAGIEWQRRAAGVSDSQQSRLLLASRLASRAGQLDMQRLTKLPHADYIHTGLSKGYLWHADLFATQVRLLETLPGFVPAIKTFLGQWQPNVAVFMVSTCTPIAALDPVSSPKLPTSNVLMLVTRLGHAHIQAELGHTQILSEVYWHEYLGF